MPLIEKFMNTGMIMNTENILSHFKQVIEQYKINDLTNLNEIVYLRSYE